MDGEFCRPHAKKAAELEADPAGRSEPEGEPEEPILLEEAVVEQTASSRAVVNLRAALTEDATGNYAKIWDLIDAALTADRETFATCSYCRKRTPITVADMTARVQAAKLLIEQTAGRPSSNEPTKLDDLQQQVRAVTSEAFRAMSDPELHAYMLFFYARDPGAIDREAELLEEIRAAVAEGEDVAGRVIGLAERRRLDEGEPPLTEEQREFLREKYNSANRNEWDQR